MQIDKDSIVEIVDAVANRVVELLEERGVLRSAKQEKSAFQRTEQLLYNYVGFKRIVDERMQQVVEIQTYGVPQSCAIKERVQGGSVQKGLVLPEESVEDAVQRIVESVQDTIRAIEFIDEGMDKLKVDPYYRILEMRYFEGRTQEDIATDFGVTQVTISNNKNRLVRELSMQLFPSQVANEMMK